ncbi:Peroxidase 43 [Sesamum angolense]|uniref:Peroxidase n=1 Tax=Sesamum angolense TaxID=2727404 RepID=A0AAE1X5F5_9LAMI|nr:Peroxidase 43 [Sesamum angolense]
MVLSFILLLITTYFLGFSQSSKLGSMTPPAPTPRPSSPSSSAMPPRPTQTPPRSCSGFTSMTASLGCEGSILIDNGRETDERQAFGHQGVGGFDIIERAKSQLEAECPGTVSCADIVALAARDAVVVANGPFYEVETGRRDGMVSNVKLADDMPDVADSIMSLKAKFFQKGLNEKDLVLLSAAHTIGTAACFFMGQRLYSFTPAGGSDPSINPVLLPELKSTCPEKGDVGVRLPIDRGSAETFDIQILQNIRSGFAVLQSDASLYQDEATRSVVDSYFVPFGASFEADFASAMVRMGRIGVLTGSQGTIRRTCAAFN